MTNQKVYILRDLWNKKVYWAFTDIARNRTESWARSFCFTSSKTSFSEATCLPYLRHRGHLWGGLKERKLFKFIVAIYKEGGWAEVKRGRSGDRWLVPREESCMVDDEALFPCKGECSGSRHLLDSCWNDFIQEWGVSG